MIKKPLVLISGFALMLFWTGLAFGQQSKERGIVGGDEARPLGRNFAVTLMVEPAQAKESFTIVTATEHFMAETEVGKGEERIELRFEGRIVLRETQQMTIGERSVGGGRPILVNYRIKVRGVREQQQRNFAFDLQGSALLEENKEVVIARSKNLTLKVKISGL
jgi:hypothetical protein